MSKQFWLKIGVIAVILISMSFIVYFFFPRIWGDILYPLDYDGYVVRYSKEYNLDSSLVAAVIYAESRYHLDSVSRAGARGLMQLMPATAKSISSKMGEGSFSADQLFNPETNIKYGCWYLRYLFDNYPDNQNAVLAAYNGGGAVGDRYVAARESGVPRETSGFIKTVNFAQEMYKKLYSDRLNTDISAESIAQKMRLQEAKQETWLEKIIKSIRGLTGR